MKQYVIDELRPADFQKLKQYFDENHPAQAVAGLHWIYLDPELLGDLQAQHSGCRPFYFAVELMPNRISAELLVRAAGCIRCRCIAYATAAQRNWFIDRIDAILDKLEIRV